MKILPLAIVLLFFGCDIPSMEFVPSEEFISKHYSDFLVDSKNIKGIEGNNDIDALLFSYETSDKNAIVKIENRLLKQKWITYLKTNTEIVIFKTLLPGQGELSFHSFELAKISFLSSKVCVGRVQMDSSSPMTISSKTSESKWANEYFWPKYEQCKNT